MATLLLIRHGQASYGQVDYDRLSTRGEQQASVLGTYLAAQKLDALYVGPLKRQVQTAELATQSAQRTLPVAVPVPELAEYPAFEMIHHFMPKLVAEDPDYATLATTPTRGLADRAFKTILERWSRDEWQLDAVERVSAFSARVRAGLDRIIADVGSGGKVAIITSAGPIGVAIGLVFGASDQHMVRTSVVVRNASISELRLRTKAFAWHPDHVSMLSFNSVGHLPSDLHTEY